MAPRVLSPRPMRLFVAVNPPEASARAMLAALPAWAEEHRVVPASQVHLTLFFIGDTHPRDLEHVSESVARAAGGLRGFALTPTRLLTLPESGAPRLLAATTDQPASLMEVQRRLAHRLVRKAGTAKDNRFLPHFTLCRIREGAPAPPRVDEPLALAGMPVEDVLLVQSVLRREGPEHTVVARVPLE